MTDSMVERVARAICPFSQPCPDVCDPCASKARAAIAAMREPTEEMISAGEGQVWEYDHGWGISASGVTVLAWETMIDAALKTDPQPGAAASIPADTSADQT
jgi:hypothetical protein